MNRSKHRQKLLIQLQVQHFSETSTKPNYNVISQFSLLLVYILLQEHILKTRLNLPI